VSWPGQGSLYSDAAQSAAGDVLFSPSGGYVAYSTALSETPAGPFVVRLVDLQDGSSVDVPRENSGSFCWMSGDQLAVVHDDLTMTTYNAAGEAIGQATAPDSWATASQDGSTVVFWNPDQGSDAPAVLRAGSLTTLQAPAEVWHVYPSPDGSRLVVGTAGYRSYLTTF